MDFAGNRLAFEVWAFIGIFDAREKFRFDVSFKAVLMQFLKAYKSLKRFCSDS